MDYTNKSNMYLSYEWADDIKEIANQLKRIVDVLECEKVKHGHWEKDSICSVCGKKVIKRVIYRDEIVWEDEYDYCPHCGAKMNYVANKPAETIVIDERREDD